MKKRIRIYAGVYFTSWKMGGGRVVSVDGRPVAYVS